MLMALCASAVLPVRSVRRYDQSSVSWGRFARMICPVESYHAAYWVLLWVTREFFRKTTALMEVFAQARGRCCAGHRAVVRASAGSKKYFMEKDNKSSQHLTSSRSTFASMRLRVFAVTLPCPRGKTPRLLLAAKTEQKCLPCVYTRRYTANPGCCICDELIIFVAK